MTVSHHHQDGNLIPLLPFYYQPDFDCFVDKVHNPVPTCFEVYTGIPIPAQYEAQPADFDILLNYLPLDHPSHPRNTAFNPVSLVHSCLSAQLNVPSLR